VYSVRSGIVQSLQMSVQHRMYDEAELKLRTMLNSSVGLNTVFYHSEKDCLFNEDLVMVMVRYLYDTECPCLVSIDGGWFATDWDDPLVEEDQWEREQLDVWCHFYDIEHGLNGDEIPF